MAERNPDTGISSLNSCESGFTPSMVAELTPLDVRNLLNNLVQVNKSLCVKLSECNQRLNGPQGPTADPQSAGDSHAPDQETEQDWSQPSRPACSVTDNGLGSLASAGNDPTSGRHLSTLDSSVRPEQVQTTVNEDEIQRYNSTLENWHREREERKKHTGMEEVFRVKNAVLLTLTARQQSSFSVLQNELQTACAQRDEYGLALSESKGEVEQLRQQLGVEKQDAKERADEILELKKSLEEQRQVEAELQKAKEKLQQANSAVLLSEQQLNSLKQQVDQQAAQSAAMAAENGKLNSVVADMEGEITRLKNNLHELKINKVRKQAAEIKELRESNEQLQAELSALKKQHEQRINAKSSELNTALQQLAAAMDERDSLRRAREQDKEQSDSLMQSLQQELSSLQQEVRSLLQELSSLKEQREVQRGEIQKLDAERSDLDASLRREKQRFAECRQELSSVKEELGQAEQRYAECRQELSSVKEQLDARGAGGERSGQTADQCAEIKRLRQDNNELRLKVDRLKNSHASLTSLLSGPTSQVDVERQGQLDELRGLLAASEDLVKKRGDTIAELNRELTQRVEKSEAYTQLKLKVSSLEQNLREALKTRDEESRKSQALSEERDQLVAKNQQLTGDLEALQLDDMRRRHASTPMSPAANSAAAMLLGPISLAATGGGGSGIGAAIGSLQGAAAAQSYLGARPWPQRQPAAGGQQGARGGAAAQNRFRTGRGASGILCSYCKSEMPDADSLFVHQKDCPRRPPEYDS